MRNVKYMLMYRFIHAVVTTGVTREQAGHITVRREREQVGRNFKPGIGAQPTFGERYKYELSWPIGVGLERHGQLLAIQIFKHGFGKDIKRRWRENLHQMREVYYS